MEVQLVSKICGGVSKNIPYIFSVELDGKKTIVELDGREVHTPVQLS
jgi:hypothetical protein